MNDSIERMREGLKTGMQIESDGYNFYRMAAQAIHDPQGQNTFQELADEELVHLKFLNSQNESLEKTGQINPDLKLGSHKNWSDAKQIFSGEIVKRIKDAHFEMSALSIGMLLELKSINFYKERVEEETDARVKDFYKELVAWETGHYNALFRQQELLRENYYATGTFAPF